MTFRVDSFDPHLPTAGGGAVSGHYYQAVSHARTGLSLDTAIKVRNGLAGVFTNTTFIVVAEA